MEKVVTWQSSCDVVNVVDRVMPCKWIQRFLLLKVYGFEFFIFNNVSKVIIGGVPVKWNTFGN